MPDFSIEEMLLPQDLIPERIKQIKSLMRQLLHDRDPFWIDEERMQQVIKQDNIWVYTAISDGKIIGMFSMYLIETIVRRLLVIEELVVDENHRRKGIASALMKAAINFASSIQRVDCIELNVGKDNGPARQLYSKLGFTDRDNDAFRLRIKTNAF